MEIHQNANLSPPREVRLIAARLHALLEPVADPRVLDVHVLDADGPAIGLAEGRQQLSQRALRQAQKMVRVERAIQVGLRQAELRKLQQRIAGFPLAQGIEVS